MMSPLVLIDGSGFIFRAFHALPPLTRPGDGTPVGAVYGFCNMLNKLLDEQKGARILVIFDAGRKSFRTELYPDYKAHRPPPPPELVPQFPLFRQAAKVFGCAIVEQEGYEADDLIASYVRAIEVQGGDVQIFSSDKDLMQLIRSGVRMIDPMKGVEIGLAEIDKKFGVTPDKIGDVLALAGDAADNVPGAPGIGVKTAAQLLNEYGDLETLLARAEEIKQPKRRATLVDFADQIRLSRKLVTLDENAPLPIPLDEVVVPEPNEETLVNWLQEQGFRSLASRRASRAGVPVSAVQAPSTLRSSPVATGQNGGNDNPVPSIVFPIEPSYGNYELVQKRDTLVSWIAQAREKGIVAVDTETDSLSPSTTTLVGVSLSCEAGKACYIPLNHKGEGQGDGDQGGLFLEYTVPAPEQIPQSEALALLKPLLEDPSVLKIGQNMKFDWQVFAQFGINVFPYDDTMLLSAVLDNGLHGHGMDELSERFLGHKPIPYSEVCGTGKKKITFDQVPLDKACDYAAEDADVTLRLWCGLKPRLVYEGQTTLYETIERPLVRVVGQMEQDGILVDAHVLRRLSQDFAQKMARLEQEIYKLAGAEFNIASPKQLGEVLFDNLQLPGGKKSKTGAWVTDADMLDSLAAQGYEIAQKVLDFRQFHKLRSTYTEALGAQINSKTGRVHTSFSLAATTTGRFSSSDPNLQNIPIRTPEGRSIRKAFIAGEGNVLLAADYSQIELRLLAHVADIPALKEAFIRGEDIHARTASEVFGIPLDRITSEDRRKAKAINFGIIYGISAFGLSRQLSIAQGEAAEFIKIYFKRFPELQDYMEAMKEQARNHGFVETLFGRKCHISGMNDKNFARRGFAERQAINAPLQGSAADIIKKAMNRIPSALAEARLSARMLLQVHDELVFEVPKEQAGATASLVQSIMQDVVSLSVPLLVDVGVADNWADAH